MSKVRVAFRLDAKVLYEVERLVQQGSHGDSVSDVLRRFVEDGVAHFALPADVQQSVTAEENIGTARTSGRVPPALEELLVNADPDVVALVRSRLAELNRGTDC